MNDELHAAGLVEETFEDDRLLRWQHAERGTRRGEIVDQLFGRRRGQAKLLDQAIDGDAGVDVRNHVLAQTGYGAREFIAATGRLAQPERNRRRLPMCILHAYASGFDAQDAVRGIAQLENVAGQAFDGEVLVDRADELIDG